MTDRMLCKESSNSDIVEITQSCWSPCPAGKQAFMNGCLKFAILYGVHVPSKHNCHCEKLTCKYSYMCKLGLYVKHTHYNLLIHNVMK